MNEKINLDILNFIGDVFGKKVEIVLHDFYTGEIIWMKGNLTGRKKGDVNDPEVLKTVAERAALDSGSIIGYKSFSESKIPLRSSVHLIKNDDNIRYMLCINEDISDFVQLEKIVANMGPVFSVDKYENEEETIYDTIKNIIAEELMLIVPMTVKDRQARLQILKRLDEKGVLKMRHVMPKICKELGINQSTYYKYLREIRENNK